MHSADVARLIQLQQALQQGYHRVLWCDADVLVFAPDRLELPDTSYAFGREVWVQEQGGTLRAFTKVHNAVMLFCRGNPFLDFYSHAVHQIVRQHQGKMAPQMLGPKFLSTIHNIIQCPVIEGAGMLSPAVMRDLLRGGGLALDLFLAQSPATPGALNLCSSLVASGEISATEITEVTRVLQAEPGKYF